MGYNLSQLQDKIIKIPTVQLINAHDTTECAPDDNSQGWGSSGGAESVIELELVSNQDSFRMKNSLRAQKEVGIAHFLSADEMPKCSQQLVQGCFAAKQGFQGLPAPSTTQYHPQHTGSFKNKSRNTMQI